MNYYEILGINKNASKAEIKRAYLNAAKTHHPDKGGDVEEFKRIQEAYDVLYNDAKRAEYDETGEVAPEIDERQKINQELSQLLLDVINYAPDDSNYLDEMREAIMLNTRKMSKLIQDGEALVMRRQKALERIIRKDGKTNLLATTIEQDIDGINRSIQQGLSRIALNEKLCNELENYILSTNELTTA